MKTSKLIICADDFGMSSGVNQAILNLIGIQKINAVSVMVNYLNNYPADFESLKSLSYKIHTGIHLDLEIVLKFSSVTSIVKAVSNKDKIRNEILRQIDVYNEFFGKYPDFIDSHHHQHLHPVVNAILIDIVKGLSNRDTIYVRNTYSNAFFYFFSLSSSFKKLFLDIMGLYAKYQYAKNNIITNDSFLGVISYDSDQFSASFLIAQIKKCKGFTILYTHPALFIEDLKGVDDYLEGRMNEYKVLSEFEINQN